MTSEQRRNVMACRKLAQQRVLRIMQQQTAEQAARMANERAAEREGLTQIRTRRPNSEKRDFFNALCVQNETLIPPTRRNRRYPAVDWARPRDFMSGCTLPTTRT
jgi:hypothetical protein